jgi:methylmalonyl-CoA/ethylmalonyl-CoA epimerase
MTLQFRPRILETEAFLHKRRQAQGRLTQESLRQDPTFAAPSFHFTREFGRKGTVSSNFCLEAVRRLPVKVLGINHIGIAAKDPVKARWFFTEILGLPFIGEELVREQKTNTYMFQSGAGLQAPSARLEILANQDGEDGPIKKFIDTKGGGIHHMALHVDDLDNALRELKAQNIELIDHEPRDGAHQTRIAFIHPRATGGILIELVQAKGFPSSS